VPSIAPDRSPLSAETQRALAVALTRWFGQGARDLPWRKTRDPYAIWVSEIMLQQTRVETVERYWKPFLDRFPTVEVLAAADRDEVLEQWSGLGYYRRARLLHEGARYVAGECGGALPEAARGLRAIPGVGRYTAGAIASIAFDQPEALVDGNVARVHARLAGTREPSRQDAKAEHHWEFAAGVLGAGSPRILAQALMELGATVCTPRSPSCEVCPVHDHCRARAAGLESEIPAPKQRKRSPEHHFYALALRRGEKLLLERRPETGLLAGMWCLPLFERRAESGSGDASALLDLAQAGIGVPMRLSEDPDGVVKHVFTHRVWHLIPWQARASRAVRTVKREDGRELAWVEKGGVVRGGVPTLTRKLLRAIGERSE